MNYKNKMKKIRSYSHSLRKVMNVFYWVSIIASCGSLIAAIIIKFMSSSHFVINETNTGHSGFSLDGLIKYDLNEVVLQGVNTKNIYISIMIMSALIFILLIPAFKYLTLILKTVEENKPFAIENSKRISSIGFLLMIGAFLIPAIQVFVANIIIDTLKIQHISTNYSVNINLILVGFMMFILSGIFKYGSYLQQEYDETI